MFQLFRRDALLRGSNAHLQRRSETLKLETSRIYGWI
jgi:hypothetical protein